MSVAEEMRINARARRNHCDRLLDAHNPAEAKAWRAVAQALDDWAVQVDALEADLAAALKMIERHELA
jgi:hypothetical protein